MRVLPLLLALLPITASAVPMEFNHQGRLFDSTSVPLDGAHDLTFAIYDDPSAGAELWSETQTGVVFENGHYSVQIGAVTTLDSDVFDGSTLYMGLTVDSASELPTRLSLVSVPYAIRAATADNADHADDADHAAMADEATTADSAITAETATNLSGGTVDATEIRIGGVTVIDSSGAITAAPSTHTHPFSDITGVLTISQIPVGTGVNEVAAGDHGHTAIDVGALPASTTAADIGALPSSTTAADIGALPSSTTAADIGALPASTTAADIGALPSSTTAADIGALPDTATAADVGALPDTATAADVGALPDTATAADVGALPDTTTAADIGAVPASGGTVSGDLGVTGVLQVGDTSATCNSGLAGTIRWNGTQFEGCDGSAWVGFGIDGVLVRYVRVHYVNSPWAWSHPNELGLYDSSGTNVAQGASTSLTGGSMYDHGSCGNWNCMTNGNFSCGEYIRPNNGGHSTTDLGSIQRVTSMRYMHYCADARIEHFRIEFSQDGSSWNEVWDLSSNPAQCDPCVLSGL